MTTWPAIPPGSLAYEHAARYCLYADELNGIGPVLVRRVEGDPEYSTPEFIRWLPQP